MGCGCRACGLLGWRWRLLGLRLYGRCQHGVRMFFFVGCWRCRSWGWGSAARSDGSWSIGWMPRRDFVGMEFFEAGASLSGALVARILLEEGLIGRSGRGVVVQVAKIDVSLGQQGVCAIAAFRVFAAEKLILTDRIVKGFFILKNAALLREQLGDGEDAGVGLGRRWIVVIDGAVKIEDALVVAPGALILGSGFEGLAGKLGLRIRRGDRLVCRGRGGEACSSEDSQQYHHKRQWQPEGMMCGARYRDLTGEEACACSMSNGTRHKCSRDSPPETLSL